MSIASEITRLQNAKASIKSSIESKGVTVSSSTKLDGYSTLIDSIQTGSALHPMNVSNIVAKTNNGSITLTWSDPQDTYDDDGQLMCSWAGTKVVYKTGSYPSNQNDGTVAVNSTTRNQYSTNGLTISGLTNGTEYYFQIFTYSDTGYYNTNSVNRISAIPGAVHIYGVRHQLTDSGTTWERLEDAIGLTANATHDGTAVTNDFDSLYPWSDIISCNYDFTNDTVNAYYGDTSFKFDGSNGDVMTKIPEFWWKREQKDGYEYQYIADGEVEGFTKSNEFMVGRYTISGSSSAVYSRSGYSPLVSTKRTDFRTYARNKGTNTGIIDWRYFLLQMLYLVEYANTNSQSTLGYGVCDASFKVNSGGCDTLGMKSGCVTNDKKHSVIYRGIEDIFGNVYQWVDGININSRRTYICYNPANYVDDTFSGNYSALSYTNSSSSGYVSKLGYDSNNSLIAMPTEVSGSSSTYYCDYYDQNSGNKIACVGGDFSSGANVGLWYWSCYYSSSYSDSYIGSRLLKY